ncbi:14-3-3 protein-like protein 2 [Aphelenchoides avenae]|nr:14-3-3 protein-like protein 2 [Aphelenchus avenae]
MAQSMKKVVKLGSELSTEERNLLSTAYKHAVGGRRFSRCIISSIDKKTIDSAKKHHVKEYREPVKNELRGMCNEVLNLLGNFLVPHARDHEPRAFFLKMKEDYYRYLAPRSPLAETGSAIAAATVDLDALSEDAYKESMQIMRSLRDNLTLYKADSVSDHQENKPAEAVTELTEDDIKNLVELKMREMNFSSLNTYFSNDMAKLQEFIELKCSSFVAIATVEDEAFAFYGQSPRSP